MSEYGSLPFAEQVAFFRRKLDLPSARWDDIWQEEHDRAFVVAGAAQADLLADLHDAVGKAIEDGATLEQFRRDFDRIVEERGWTGWAGEETAGGRAWRTRVIYGTNLRTSYAAGRHAQLLDVAGERPYWRYRHSGTVLNPRPEHQAWDGMILRFDDPFWATNYPPNGWGCRCYIESLAERDMVRMGRAGPDSAPELLIDPETGAPEGVDPGWAYAPGASVSDELRSFVKAKGESLIGALAKDFLAVMLVRLAGGAGGGIL